MVINKESIDLRMYSGGIHDQLNTGSCMANATVTALEIMLSIKDVNIELSRMYNYYYGREDNSVDTGMYFTSALESAVDDGLPEEKYWEFDLTHINVEPIADPVWFITDYTTLPIDVDNTVLALNLGFPVILDMSITTAWTFLDDIDDEYYGTPLGFSVARHAVVAVGNGEDYFIIENSYGEEWGGGGYFNLSHEVFLQDVHNAAIITGFGNKNLKIEELYQNILGRTADDAGHDYWVSRHISYRDIARNFYSSEEFLSSNETDYVEDTYHEVLGRDPDLRGHEFWLESGLNKAELVGIFLNSNEFING